MNFGRLSRERSKMTEENSIWKNNLIISWSVIIGIFYGSSNSVISPVDAKKLRSRKILNPLPRDMNGEGEKVEIEVELSLDQANSALAAESKVEDLTAEKKIRLSPQNGVGGGEVEKRETLKEKKRILREKMLKKKETVM